MSNTVQRIAVIGAGYFSQFHLHGWQHATNVQVVALCDADLTKAKTLAQQYGIEKIFNNATQMLDSVQLDLVDIVVPPVSQNDLIRSCIDRKTAIDRKSTRLNSSHRNTSRMPSSA